MRFGKILSITRRIHLRDRIGSSYSGQGEIMRGGHEGSGSELEEMIDLKAAEKVQCPPAE